MKFNTIYFRMYIAGLVTKAQVLGYFSELTSAQFDTAEATYAALHG